MFRKKFYTHMLKAQMVAEDLNEQLTAQGKKKSAIKIVPQKIARGVEKWYLTFT